VTDEKKEPAQQVQKPKRPSPAELARQHRQRFKFTLECGQEIVLKHLGKLEHQQVFMEICAQDPEYERAAGLVAKYNEVDQYPGGKDNLLPDQRKERDWAFAKCAIHNSRYYVPCFVVPKSSSMEELENYLGMMTEKEWDTIQKMLLALTAPITSWDRNLLMVGIAAEYGIRWAPDLFLENMTLQQYQVLIENEKAKAEAMAEAARKMREPQE